MQRCPIKSGVSECDPETSNFGRTRQTKDVKALKKTCLRTQTTPQCLCRRRRRRRRRRLLVLSFHSSLAGSQQSIGLTAQAVLIHCFAKNFLTVWNLLSVGCVRIYRAGKRLSLFGIISPCGLYKWYYVARFQLPYSEKLFFQVCILTGLLGDGAVKVVTVRHVSIYICVCVCVCVRARALVLLWWLVKYNCVRSIVINSWISCYGRVVV
jgi:hypothetical protein